MIVYMLRSKSSGKSYVGQTKKTAEARFRIHVKNARAGSKQAICLAIVKYGQTDFEISVLQICQSQEELDAAEISWIAARQTIAPLGYNLAAGGYGSASMTPEIREKIAASKRGLKRPASVGEAISLAQLGRKQSSELVERRIGGLRGKKTGPRPVEIVKKLSGEGGPSARLDWLSVREIRRQYALGTSQRALAKQFGVGQMTISLIVNNKTWKEESCPQ